ncbi:MAG: hypothetical protein KJO52_01370 [Maribacter sp.]|nr:hypothetical protein [Maribacter sp.]
MSQPFIAPGTIYLNRLSRFIDVVYALIFFHIMSQYLPHFEDMSWTERPYGLLSHVWHERTGRIIIGVGPSLLYWNQNNSIFKHLKSTNSIHAAFSLVQLFFVIVFVYFAIADPGLVTISSPALQAASLAIAGFISIALWKYAVKKGLIVDGMSEEDIKQVTRSNLMEPCAATINIGLAFIGPLVWTLAWFVLPVIFTWILKKRSK